MTPRDRTGRSPLLGKLGRFQLFAFGFGSIVGSAWVVVLSKWLNQGGPGGAVVGFLAGGLVMLAIGRCYAELSARIPATGGEFIFALHVYGRKVAFFVGWFTALSWICIAIFEGIAISWFVELLLPSIRTAPLYSLLGSPVAGGPLALGALATFLIIAVNHAGGSATGGFQGILTYGFLAVAVVIILALAGSGNAANLEPFLPRDSTRSWWIGGASVFANCAFLLNGFQSVCQVIEERSSGLTLRTAGRVLLLSIAAATLFYCAVVLASSSAVPWQTLATSDLAIVAAADTLPGGAFWGTLIIVIAIASLMKTWNGVFMMGVRTVVALARERLLPSALAHVDARTGAPTRAVLAVGACNLLGLLLGRGAIEALVDTSATSVVACFVLSCVAVLILRRRDGGARLQDAPGGSWGVYFGIAGSLLMAGAALVTPALRGGDFPVEYTLMLLWGAIGLAYWFARERHD